MTAKDYLRGIAGRDAKVDRLLERRDHYRAMASSGTATTTATRVSGTGGRSRVEDYVIRLIDLEKEIDQATDTYVDAKHEAVMLIECLCDQRFRHLLTWRYICCWDWERVRCGLKFSTIQSAHNLHSAALIEFQKVLYFYYPEMLAK